LVAPAFADAPGRFVRKRICGAKRKAGRIHPVSEAMLPPATGTDKAVSMPRRSAFAALLEQKSAKSAIYPAISRLEPDSDLGQKNALLRTFSLISQG